MATTSSRTKSSGSKAIPSSSGRFCGGYSKAIPSSSSSSSSAFASSTSSSFSSPSSSFFSNHHDNHSHHHRSASPTRVNLYNPQPMAQSFRYSLDSRSISPTTNRSISVSKKPQPSKISSPRRYGVVVSDEQSEYAEICDDEFAGENRRRGRRVGEKSLDDSDKAFVASSEKTGCLSASICYGDRSGKPEAIVDENLNPRNRIPVNSFSVKSTFVSFVDRPVRRRLLSVPLIFQVCVVRRVRLRLVMEFELL
ncbi:hypothetical protein Bca101_012129 [Brassica carinata]